MQGPPRRVQCAFVIKQIFHHLPLTLATCQQTSTLQMHTRTVCYGGAAPRHLACVLQLKQTCLHSSILQEKTTPSTHMPDNSTLAGPGSTDPEPYNQTHLHCPPHVLCRFSSPSNSPPRWHPADATGPLPQWSPHTRAPLGARTSAAARRPLPATSIPYSLIPTGPLPQWSPHMRAPLGARTSAAVRRLPPVAPRATSPKAL